MNLFILRIEALNIFLVFVDFLDELLLGFQDLIVFIIVRGEQRVLGFRDEF